MELPSPCNHDNESMENKDKNDFYNHAAVYWSNVPATVDGMLGGYGHISTVDINGSSQFLKQLFRLKSPPGKFRALDCGAGIGRITKNLLLNHFRRVDLVEQNPAFVAQARAALETHQKMGKFFCCGLQDFTPEPAAYDVIWCQWVLGHLTDDDLLAFLNGCIRGLKTNGVIVLKENTTTNNELDVDATDSSVTRPLHLLCELLQRAGLRCVKQKRQVNFPHGLYPVYMIATRPSLGSIAPSSCSELVSVDAASEGINETQGKIEESCAMKCDVEEVLELTSGRMPGSHTTLSLDYSVSVGQLPAAGAQAAQPSPGQPRLSDDLYTKDAVLSNVLTTTNGLKGSDAIDENSKCDDRSPSEKYEQEETEFPHEVEYSSDDSTKTESSTTENCSGIHIATISEPSPCTSQIMGLEPPRRCDIA